MATGLGTDGGSALGASPSLWNIGGKVGLDGALAFAPQARALDLRVMVLNVLASESEDGGAKRGLIAWGSCGGRRSVLRQRQVPLVAAGGGARAPGDL